MQCSDWLIVLLTKAHVSFIAGLWVNMRSREKSRIGLEAIGDNMPHVFLKPPFNNFFHRYSHNHLS